MFRAGFARQLTEGIYFWLPPGWRIASKIAALVREKTDISDFYDFFFARKFNIYGIKHISLMI